MKQDKDLLAEIGAIRGFGFFLSGSINKTTEGTVVTGTADFELIARGERKFKDITIFLEKKPDTFWEVTFVK